MSAPSVLTTSRFLLSLAQLGNKKQIKMGKFRIPKIVNQALYILPISVFPLYLIQYCIDEHFKLDRIAGAVGLIFGVAQMICIYFCLAANNSLIANTFNELQRIVNERSFPIQMNNNIINKEFFTFIIHILFRVYSIRGCDQSIFQRREEKQNILQTFD